MHKEKVIRIPHEGPAAAAGYEWAELRYWRSFWKATLFWFAVISVLLAWAVSALPDYSKTNEHQKIALVFLLIGACEALGGFYLRSTQWIRRSLVFQVDGKIVTEYGIPNQEYLQVWNSDLSKVNSIEASRGCVWVYLRDGKILGITQYMHPDYAHRVSVQLTRALQEIRDSIANNNARRSSRLID